MRFDDYVKKLLLITESSRIRGEYWIDGSAVMYADGDIGDKNHESFVVDRLLYEVADILDLELDEEASFDDIERLFLGEYSDEYYERALEENPDLDRDEFDEEFQGDVYSHLSDKLRSLGVSEEMVSIISGSSRFDPRVFAEREWGWKRVHGHNVESYTLTRGDLDSIRQGMWEIADQEGIDTEDREALDEVVYLNSVDGKKYLEITLGDLLDGNYEELGIAADDAGIGRNAAVDKLDRDLMNPHYRGLIGDSVVADRFARVLNESSGDEYYRMGDGETGKVPPYDLHEVDLQGTAWNENTVSKFLAGKWTVDEIRHWIYFAYVPIHTLEWGFVENDADMSKCDNCGGTGEVECENCGGMELEDEEECEECGGRGTQDCYICDGTGVDRAEYDWTELQGSLWNGRSSPPPGICIRTGPESATVQEGNHRVHFWSESGFERAPMWVFDLWGMENFDNPPEENDYDDFIGESMETPTVNWSIEPDAMGLTPKQRDIHYFGFAVQMSPEKFLRIASRQYGEGTSRQIEGEMRSGRPVAPPFLQAKWDDGSKVWKVLGHEGRNRVMAFNRIAGGKPMDVHIFPVGSIRAKHITDEMRNAGFLDESYGDLVTEETSIDASMDKEYLKAVESGDDKEIMRLVVKAYKSFGRNTVSLPVSTSKGYEWFPVTYLRFGDVRTDSDGNQTNSEGFNGLIVEKGVSVFAAWYDDVTGKYVISTGSEQSLAGVNDVILQDRPIFIVEGVVTGEVGDDGEPLLKPGTVKTVGRITMDDVVTDDYPYITLGGIDLEGGDVPKWSGRGVDLPRVTPVIRDDNGKIIPLSERFSISSKLVTEKKDKQTVDLRRNFEPKRKKRSKNVKIRSLQKFTPSTTSDDKPLPKGWKRWEFEAESKERTEGRTHKGYVVLNKDDSVKDAYCGCGDFQFRWRYVMGMGGDKAMSSKEVVNGYKDIETKAPYTGDSPDITNPERRRHLCKHLQKILDGLKI